MSRAPLKLNWNELFDRDAAPPPELEVVAGVDAAAADGDASATQFSDQELNEKIQRILKHISSGLASRLPDKGAKLRQNHGQLQAELDRRKLARFATETGGPEEARQSRSSEICVSNDVRSLNYTKSEPSQQSSFGSLFYKKLEHKADAPSEQKSRFISRDKCGSLRRNEEQKYVESHQNRVSLRPIRMSFRQSSFRCSSNIANRDMQRSSNGVCRITEASKISSSHLRRNFSGHSPKKRRALDSRDSSHPRSNKVHNVVLLDDEEVQPAQSIHNDTSDEWKKVKIYYPSRDDPESIELSYSDIKCLDPREYLSSPVMNFYIRYLQKPVSPAGKARGGYYFFNTYFYKKLEEAILCTGDRSARFLKLRRWWKGVNIFQKAYIFLPIHNQSHWSLVIICIPAKEDESGPVVLHLDSLQLHATKRIFDVVDSCLKQEWNYLIQNDHPLDVPFPEKIWKDLPQRTEKKKIVVPQQNNEYDCGLFVLYFMERFIKGAPGRLKKKDLSSMFGKKWFMPEDASGLRGRIRDLLVEEFENARLENGRTESPASSSGSDSDQRSEP